MQKKSGKSKISQKLDKLLWGNRQKTIIDLWNNYQWKYNGSYEAYTPYKNVTIIKKMIKMLLDNIRIRELSIFILN